MSQHFYNEIEVIIRNNLEQRGMDKIWIKGEIEKAAKQLFESSTVFIVTGFVIRDVLAGETDGPIGAVSLAGALEQLGKKVVLITDKYTENILHSCCLVKNIKANIEIVPYNEADKFCNKLLYKHNPSHIVGIERPGKAKDGRYYSMRGEDLKDIVPNTDILFKMAKDLGIVTLAIGDGGNEVGMGKALDYLSNLEKNKKIYANFSADYLIVSGVSNWGGHALVATLSILNNDMLLHEEKIETALLESMIKAGAVDGCTKENSLTVDGLSLEYNIDIFNRLRKVVELVLCIKNEKILAIL